VLLEQIRTLDKKRLKERMGTLDLNAMQRVNQALQVSFGLGNTDDVGDGNIT
jgi:mRNA interferase MazF